MRIGGKRNELFAEKAINTVKSTVMETFKAAHYSVKLKKDEKLLLEHLGVRDTPRHRDIFCGLTSFYATEEEALQYPSWVLSGCD